MYPTLPTPPIAGEGEPKQHYGARLLQFVIAERVTATMSDEELELAGYVVPYALWRRGTDGTDLRVVEQVRVAASLIQVTLAGRRRLEQEALATRPQGDTSPEGGRTTPLQPAPSVNPQGPAPAAAADPDLEWLRRYAEEANKQDKDHQREHEWSQWRGKVGSKADFDF